MKNKMGEKMSEMLSEHTQMMSEMATQKKEMERKMVLMDKKMSEVRNGQDADETAIVEKVRGQIIVPTIEEIEKDLPKLGESIRDALELLQDENRLDVSAIKGLEEIIASLKKQIKDKTMIVAGNSTGGKIVKVYDLSSSLNGVLKTFSLPAFWRVISVHSSSFPNAFRPTTDFTTDASAMTITFTSEINAATTLASGQTIIVTYSE